MCGIVISPRYSVNINSNIDYKIDKISHRGLPSEKNTIIVGDPLERQWCLSHVRLPIQTLEGDKWIQPIEYLEGQYLLFNGELFDYRDKEKYSCDVEYLVDFFSRYPEFPENQVLWKPEVSTWDGFWAIVLYIKGKGFISFTDPLGKKQLYFKTIGSYHLEISSEIKAINDNTILDEKTISTILKWGYNIDQRTCFQGVKRIEPNSIYLFPENNPSFYSKMERYFSFIESCNKKNFGKYSEKIIKDLLVTSVKNRLISKKFPIGVLVSGGLDSSIITSILCEHSLSNDIHFYSIDNEETEYVEELEKYFGIQVTYLSYPHRDINESPENTIYYNDSPIDMGSLFLQHSLFSVIPEKIVLTGDGADELFGGYRRIHEYDSQQSDIFDELTYYHLPRLDRASMRYTIEVRNPFLSHDLVKFALNHLSLEKRTDKKILKEAFSNSLPSSILERRKKPLKSKNIVNDSLQERLRLVNIFRKMNSVL